MESARKSDKSDIRIRKGRKNEAFFFQCISYSRSFLDESNIDKKKVPYYFSKVEPRQKLKLIVEILSVI